MCSVDYLLQAASFNSRSPSPFYVYWPAHMFIAHFVSFTSSMQHASISCCGFIAFFSFFEQLLVIVFSRVHFGIDFYLTYVCVVNEDL